MSQDSSFDELMAQLRAGDQNAATQVFHRYANRLIGLARSRLGKTIGLKVDPEDVMQSVFRSFFTRHADGQFELEGWDGLWGLLTIITIRKCNRQFEHFLARRRDVNREVSTPPMSGETDTDWEAIARDPTPSEAVMLTETVEQLMRSLPVREQHMLALRLQGHKVPEISSKVGRTERTVRRVLERIKRHLEQLRAQDLEGA